MSTRVAIASAAWMLVVLQAAAADVSTYAVLKNRSFFQTNATDIGLSGANPFQFVAVVDATTNTLTSATLKLPSGTVLPLTNTPGVGPFSIAQSFASQAAMDAVFTNGTYQFTLNTVNDGVRTPSLSLVGNAYPVAPQVINYPEAQLIRPDTDFAVQWAPFTGGNSLDNIVLTVRTQNGPTVFSTPIFGQPGALDGTATSVVIPAGTLATGGVYNATLTFVNVTAVDVFQYFGVPGVTAYISSTDLRMRTISQPWLTITNAPGGAAQLRFNSDPGRTYDLRASPDLANWSSLVVTTATGNAVLYLDTNAPAFDQRFYRLEEP
jgi:hypothetical protein